MEVSGRIKFINVEQVVSASFKKRELVVTTDEQYPQHIQMEFTQEKCDLLNIYKVGDDVKVSINLRGRSWTNPQGEEKYFNTIQAWRIEKHQVQGPAQSGSGSAVDAYEQKQQANNADEDPDDALPF
jgi:translation initiation factor IF-3